jgi:hypothetical protein
MKRRLLLGSVLAWGIAGVVASAQAQPPAGAKDSAGAKASSTADKATAQAAQPTRGSMGGRMKGAGMQGMQGGAGMMGGCPMMVGADTKVEVKNLTKGVSITLTSEDAAAVARLQKMAEGMRLMHEAHGK